MKVDELLAAERKIILEGTALAVYETLIPFLLIEEDGGGGDGGGDSSPGDGGTPPDVVPDPPPVQPPGGGGWYRPSPFRPGGMGFNGNHWVNQLYVTLKNLAVASNIVKRLKQLGITGEAAKRVKMAQKIAAKQAKFLLSNPGATAYKIPVMTFAAMKPPTIKMWNEAFCQSFQQELAKINFLVEGDD